MRRTMTAAVAGLVAAGAGVATLSGAALGQGKGLGTKNAPAQVGSVDASGTYQLSAEEQTYDCRKLTGRMQIRLLEVRDYDPKKNASSLSRSMQNVTEPVVGLMLGKASGYSANPDKRHRDDIAMLKAYNAQLAAKKCRTFDLDAELGTGPKSTLPAAKPPAPATPPAAPAAAAPAAAKR